MVATTHDLNLNRNLNLNHHINLMIHTIHTDTIHNLSRNLSLSPNLNLNRNPNPNHNQTMKTKMMALKMAAMVKMKTNKNQLLRLPPLLQPLTHQPQLQVMRVRVKVKMQANIQKITPKTSNSLNIHSLAVATVNQAI